MYTPKDYEIVKIEIIRDNGETISDIRIGPNSIMMTVKNHFGTDFRIGQMKDSERFIISAIRGESFYEEVSVNVIPTNCCAKWSYDKNCFVCWGKVSGEYTKEYFLTILENLKNLP
jgi:hypothetical protein